MTEEELAEEAKKLGRWGQHRFLLLVGISIVIAMLFVSVALKLYYSSGAAQLDLSRPGYEAVSETVGRTEVYKGFPSSGVIDQKAIEEFRKMYKERAAEATNVDAFGGDVMSDKALTIDALPAGE